jgi:hypothetical protein
VLGRIRGLLVYEARTYTPLTPLLLGLHLTIDGWRPGKDEDNCRLMHVEVDAIMESDEDSVVEDWKEADTATNTGLINAVTRLHTKLDVLIQLTEAK